MAVKHPINRIQVAVSPTTTSKYRGSPYIDMEFKASDHIGSRNQVITTKTGHRSGTSPRPVKQFFFLQVLPDSKNGWGNPTYFRLEGPQCLSKASTFSHAMSSRCYTGSEQKRLVRYYRPEGCLLPHSNCGTSQEVPSFSCQWSVLSICKLLLVFCTVCPYVNCCCVFFFFCTVWSTVNAPVQFFALSVHM